MNCRVFNVFVIFIFILNGVFASGWHFANEILPGTFSNGDFTFNGSIKVVSGEDICIDGGICLGSIGGVTAGNGIIVDVNNVSLNTTYINSLYLGKTAKATDSNLLDGVDSTGFVQTSQDYGRSGVSNYIYLGTDTYLYRDTANRVATADSFYVQSASPGTYLYSANTYLGDSSGDAIHIRGNVLDGTNFRVLNGQIRAASICDEGGGHCKDISTGWGSGSGCTSPSVSSSTSYPAAGTTLQHLEVGYVKCYSGRIGGGKFQCKNGALFWFEGSSSPCYKS